MAQYKFCTDILSPIQSDVSLNDTSVFSFGSLPDTPDYDKDIVSPIYKDIVSPICKNIESPICKNIQTESNINALCTKVMNKTANAFEVIANDIKKQSKMDAEKEERFKESYDMFKQSVDDLFYSKSSNSVMPPESRNFNKALKKDLNINIVKTSEDNQSIKVFQKTASSDSKNKPCVSGKKIEKNKKEASSSSIINKGKKTHQPKSACVLKESSENSKTKSRSIEIGAKKNVLIDGHKIKNSKTVVSLSAQTDKCLEERATSKTSSIKNEIKEVGNVKNFNFKCQRKIPISNDKPSIEEKSLSIEKSIEITIAMEMDNIRRFMLDQNLSIRKDLLKLQEMAKKQTEVTGYLFSVIDELVETNKKLISKYN